VVFIIILEEMLRCDIIVCEDEFCGDENEFDDKD